MNEPVGDMTLYAQCEYPFNFTCRIVLPLLSTELGEMTILGLSKTSDE